MVYNYFDKCPANWAYSRNRMPPTPNSTLIEPPADDLKYICESRPKDDELEDLIRELRQRVKGKYTIPNLVQYRKYNYILHPVKYKSIYIIFAVIESVK